MPALSCVHTIKFTHYVYAGLPGYGNLPGFKVFTYPKIDVNIIR